MSKHEIVQFKDGSYAIRRSRGYLWLKKLDYLDLHTTYKVYWPKGHEYFMDCITTDKRVLENKLLRLFDEGVPIKNFKLSFKDTRII